MPVPINEVDIGRQLEQIETGALTITAAGGVQNLFTVTGGPIYLEEFTGITVTQVTATGTVIAHIQHDPTGGVAPGTEVDMCLAAGGLDIVSVVDAQFSITGAVAAAMVETVIGIVAAPSFMTNHQIVTPGTIQLFTVDTGAMSDIAGAINWTLVYRPLVNGVSVVVG